MQRGNAGYQHARQACYLCLNPEDGVDTEVQIDYEGVLFLCKNCVREMCVFLGYEVDASRQDEIDALKRALEQANADGADSIATLAEMDRLAKSAQQKKMAKLREAKAAKVDA
jgi:hypothetical protein